MYSRGVNNDVCPSVVSMTVDLKLKPEITGDVLTYAKEIRDDRCKLVESRAGVDRDASRQERRSIRVGHDYSVAEEMTSTPRVALGAPTAKGQVPSVET